MTLVTIHKEISITTRSKYLAGAHAYMFRGGITVHQRKTCKLSAGPNEPLEPKKVSKI